jgi:hypothetical protein
LTGPGPESAALAKYQATRDELSNALFEVTESVASYTWTLDEVRVLLRKVSSAMKAEVTQFSL